MATQFPCPSGCEESGTYHKPPIDHHVRFLYNLKLDGGKFYVGKTNTLEIRLKEHQDGITRSTAGKHPKLLWFKRWEGDIKELDSEEAMLSLMTKGQPRSISRMIAEWQHPLRLIDLNA